MITDGQQIGGYRILRQIGLHAVGATYLAEDARSSARVAIKALAPELSKTKVVERFFKEARATCLLRHPGVATTLDCFLHDDRAFVVMELLNGETLAAYLRRAGPLAADLPALFAIGSAIASAVGAVHASEILHRDLRPGNVFLHLPTPPAPDVTVKILDFGIVRLSQEEDGPSQTASGLLLGTPAYMSPEQCRGAKVDHRSDIYALGCILYEAVSGRPPFLAEGMGDMVVAHLSQTPEPLAKLVPGLSAQLSALILRMLAKKPEDRPQTMGDVVRALRTCARAAQIDFESKAIVPGVPVEDAEYASDVRGAAEPPSKVMPAPAPVAPPAATTPRPSPPPVTPAPAAMPVVQLPRHHPIAQAPGSIEAAPAAAPATNLEPILGMPGETLVLKDPDKVPGFEFLIAARAASGRASPAPSSDVDIRARPGGTRVLKAAAPFKAPAAAPSPNASDRASDGASDDESDDESRDAWTRTEVVAKPRPTAFAERVQRLVRENRRSVAVAAGAATLALAVVVALSISATSPRPAPGPTTTTVARPQTTGRSAPATGAPPKPAETVEVDIRGLPAGTQVTLDDRPVTPPARIPRGPALHRLVLRPPGTPERTIDIDGTRDRTIELVTEPTR